MKLMKEDKEPWWLILGEWLWELLKTIVTVVALVYLIRGYIVQPFIIQGASMEPSFHSGQYLLVERFSRLTHRFERGDVIVFASEHGQSDDFIKRIIGLPGETVQLRDNRVFIANTRSPQGFQLVEPYLNPGTPTIPEGSPSSEIKLGPGQFYMLGDNRSASRDSRSFGAIAATDIVGKAWLVTFPLHFFGTVDAPQYSEIITG